MVSPDPVSPDPAHANAALRVLAVRWLCVSLRLDGLTTLMRHLLAVCGRRQLLGDGMGRCAENSFSKLYRESHPELLRLGMTVYLLTAQGGTTVVRDWSVTTLLAEFPVGDPDATPPIGATPATR